VNVSSRTSAALNARFDDFVAFTLGAGGVESVLSLVGVVVLRLGGEVGRGGMRKRREMGRKKGQGRKKKSNDQ
jgi:hypothetical protein